MEWRRRSRHEWRKKAEQWHFDGQFQVHRWENIGKLNENIDLDDDGRVCTIIVIIMVIISTIQLNYVHHC